MDVRIKTLKMQCFKGIQQLEVDMGGVNVSVFGKNATGKTTLFDAFTWCLFGKDSTDKTDFWVKPHDENGEEIHHLETMVEAVLLIDGRQVAFRHMVVENWVKKNGEQDHVYSGNNHKYWVNDLTKSSKEYAAAVEEIVDQEVFRLITNPMAFNAIKWDKRREFLLKLSPINVDEIMLRKAEYEPLSQSMSVFDTDVYGLKKIMLERKKRDNTELEQIPIRISEQVSIRDSLGECDTEAALAEIAAIDKKIADLEASMQTGSDIIASIKEKASALAEAEGLLNQAKIKANRAVSDEQSRISIALATAKSVKSGMYNTIRDMEDMIAAHTARVESLKKKREEIRDKWYAIDAEEAEVKVKTVCPTCGQNLPAEQVEEAKAKFLRDFEESKERRLNEITEEGKRTAEEIKALEERVAAEQKDYETAQADLKKAVIQVEDLEEQRKNAASEPDFDTPEIHRLNTILAERQEAYNKAMEAKQPVDESKVQEKQELIARKNDLLRVDAKRQQKEACDARIAELEKRSSELGASVADTERMLILIDQFVTERCGMLEESINSMFPTVRWSLFERQINGGIKDACICLIGGVQFSDANNAARINAGLEIISVLSKHYGVTVPVFIDNAEAVNVLQPMEAQRIALVVTANDKELRIEKEV